MSVKLSDLDPTSITIIKQVYHALLRAHDRLIDVVVDEDDDYRLDNTTHDIKKLCEKYPWLPELAGGYWG